MRKAPDDLLLRAAASEIKLRRATLGISQEELAFRAAVHRSFMTKVELAESQPSLTTLFRLAAGLEIEPEDLVAAISKRYRKELRGSR